MTSRNNNPTPLAQHDLNYAECALCRKNRKLVESHYIPRSFYRRMHEQEKKPAKPPILVRCSSTTYNSTQVTKFLLCCDCEERFNRGGEQWVAQCSLKSEGFFKLRSLLMKMNSAATNSKGSLYEGVNSPELRIEELMYFAASIFWRGVACDWTLLEGKPELELPDQAIEDLRCYLLGERAFPDKISIILEVARHPAQIIVFPYGGEENGFSNLCFTVSGLTFFLSAPAAYPEGDASPASLTRSPNPVLLDHLSGHPTYERLADFAWQSPLKGKLALDSKNMFTRKTTGDKAAVTKP